MAKQPEGSGITWTDQTWNPVRGCSRVSEGCRNCYAEAVAQRFGGPGQPYEGLVTLDAQGKPKRQWSGAVELIEKRLLDPLRWREPRRVFVNSMSDLFHPNVPDKWIDKVFAVMALSPKHTFQILTKRPERMLQYLSADARFESIGFHMADAHDSLELPLPNVWLGVSVEDQKAADKRIPLLLQTPARVRFVSADPLLGPVNLHSICWDTEGSGGPAYVDVLGGTFRTIGGYGPPEPKLDWVIAGGESGPGARPCDVDWISNIVRQRAKTRIPCFVKQLGSRPISTSLGDCSGCTDPDPWDARHGTTHQEATNQHPRPIKLRDRKGGDPSEWREDLRVRRFPRNNTEAE